MSALTFTLRHEPEQRLDLSALTPDALAQKRMKEVERITLSTTGMPVCVGDIFRLKKGDPADICFEGGSERFDRVGEAMTAGAIRVKGAAGARIGREMQGGTITVEGDAGPWAGSGMAAGRLIIKGSAGDWLGGPLPGELSGMRGGEVYVAGNAGKEAGHRLRRGTIIIDGDAGGFAGRAMIAGTIVVGGETGEFPGYLMRRGTLVCARVPRKLSPTFLDSGPVELVFARILGLAISGLSRRSAGVLKRPLRRLSGDLAVMGKGEILLPA